MLAGQYRFLLSLAFVSLFASAAWSMQPDFTRIDPPGVQRGAEAELTLRGRRLEDAQELMLYENGIEVTDLTVEKDNLVRAKLKIAPDCRLGLHAVRIRTETGISDLRLFSVGALPQVAEEEPNNDFEAPQTVALDSTVHGVVQNEDVDHFVVDAKKGERITAELEGLRLGNTFFDPYLAILNNERFELARSDDAALLRQDCVCSIIAPEDGKYTVQVRESAYGGDGNSKYRLHVGRFPRPRAVLPAGGKAGETLQVTWIGDVAGDRQEQVTIPERDGEGARLFARDERGISPSGNGIRVNNLQNTVESEPNDNFKEATAGTAPGALNGVIGSPDDRDCFKISAKKGQQFDVRVYARSVLRSPLDSVLVIRNAAGRGIESNDDANGPDSSIRFRAPDDGDYFVEIRDHLKSGGPTYAYRIEIAPREPNLTMSLPERQRYKATTLSVPSGNRMALLVDARRENFRDELALNFDGLPAGITFETIPMPENRNQVPVLFSAAEGAAPNGALVDVQGRTVDETLKVVGHLDQRTMLVRGRNNRDVYGHNAKRMAAAVTKAAPFKIEIVPPKAPLVRNGSMRLKVVAAREEGFTAPINLGMLYTPPGVGSSGSVTIAEGKNEAEIPVTANGNASIGVWKIIVTGSAPVGNGRVEVASQMVDLEITDVFFNLAIGKTAVEQGQQTQLIVKIEKNRDFEGEAEIQLLGLPNGASTEKLTFTKDTEEVIFPIRTEQDARVGRHKSILCRAVPMVNGEPVTHTIGSGEIRIDKPLPKVAAKPKAQAQPKEEPAKEPPKKVLSRLEQLRLAKERQENE